MIGIINDLSEEAQKTLIEQAAEYKAKRGADNLAKDRNVEYMEDFLIEVRWGREEVS